MNATEAQANNDVGRVGLVGLGRMGTPMARHLTDRDFDLTVYNRTLATAEAFASETGAGVAKTLRELAEQCSVIVMMVASGSVVVEMLEGADGLCAGLSPGDVVVDMGTTGIESTQIAREYIEKCGARLVEAPVSGSVASVETRALLIMVGGEDPAVDKAMPVLEGIADRVVRMGGNGTGAAMKVVVNSVLIGMNQVIAESLVLAERAGIERSAAYGVFATSAVAAPVVKYRRDVFEHPGETPVTFTIDLAIKDLTLVLELAKQVDASMPQTVINQEVLTAASDAGRGAADMGDVAVHLREAGPLGE